MGFYLSRSECNPGVALVAGAKSFKMYERGGIWYVSFAHDGRQLRYSTGIKDFQEAKALVESMRPSGGGAAREVDDANLIRLLERMRGRAKKKGVPFSITREQARAAATACGGYCQVTGHVLEADGPFRPSIDRIDPSAGYVAGNIRIVCLIANTAMLHYGEAAFLEIAAAICKKNGLIA